MAYKEPYWKVSMALVALATHSPKICGEFCFLSLMRSYKDFVMKIIYRPVHYRSASVDKLSNRSKIDGNGHYKVSRLVTFFLHLSDFTYPPLNASSDATSVESERLVSPRFQIV